MEDIYFDEEEQTNTSYSPNTGISTTQSLMIEQQQADASTILPAQEIENVPTGTPTEGDDIIIANSPLMNGLGGTDTLVYSSATQGLYITLASN